MCFYKLHFKWIEEIAEFNRETTRARKAERSLEKKRRQFAKELWDAAKARKDTSTPENAWEVALATYPQCVRDAWYDKKMQAICLDGKQIMKAAIEVQKDRGAFFPFEKALGTVGIFTPEMRTVRYYAKTSPGILDYPYSWKNPIDVCGHEIAHFIDWISLIPSDSENFERLFDEEGILMEEYSRNDVAEFFADACWLYVRFPEITTRWLPKTMKWFDRFFEGIHGKENPK